VPGREDVVALAARIDKLIDVAYVERNVTPAPLADDAEFLRRAYLDLAGRIPRTSEVHKFLADTSPDKRLALVEELLNGPHYVRHFSNVWRSLLLPQNNNQLAQALAPQMEAWLRKCFQDNRPYDQMVRELVTAPVAFGGRRAGGVVQPGNPFDPTPVAFFQANELKPDNLAAATSRIFLGVKLECAGCHDHPFATWKREQFWQYAAFFSGVQPQQVRQGQVVPQQDVADRKEIQIPGTDKTVQARFLDGAEPTWKADVSVRATLAEWLTSPENPYFARATANRLWGHFFGIGLIDPVDEFGEDNPASHPEVLDELGRGLARKNFDLKFLIRTLTASKAYQRTSRQTHASQDDVRAFGRMQVKGMTPEQLFDSLALATGYKEQPPVPGRGFNPLGSARAEFLAKFANYSDKRTEYQTSILQALTLMNGRVVADSTSVDLTRSMAFAAILTKPFTDDRGRLNDLYVMTLSRPMRPSEEARLVPYVSKGGPSGDSKKALADVFWALLNSSEFIMNH
jgi:hypothetical protein